MLIAGIATTATGGGMLGQAVEDKKQAQHTYQETVIEFEHLQTQCAALQILSDNFNSLAESNLKATAAVIAMMNAWYTIGNNFEGIAESVQGVVEEETKFIIKLRLKSAIKDVQSLKKFAEDCERHGILPIKTEASMQPLILQSVVIENKHQYALNGGKELAVISNNLVSIQETLAEINSSSGIILKLKIRATKDNWISLNSFIDDINHKKHLLEDCSD